MVDSSPSNTENELSLDSSSSVGVTIEGDKAVYSDEDIEKRREMAKEQDEKVTGISNPITATDGGEKGEKEEKSQNEKVSKDKQHTIKFENMDDKPFEKYLKFFYLGLAIILVVVVFFLPLILYYTDQPDDTTIINIPLNLDTCNTTVSLSVCLCT